MRTIGMFLVLGTVVAGAGHSRQAPWDAPSAGLISRNTGSLFYIVPYDTPGIALFYGGDLNSNTSHISNAATRTYDCSGRLTTGMKAVVSYRLASETPEVVSVNNKSYDLAEGRVFLIEAGGDITQIPFAPLQPSRQYATRLQEYLNASETMDSVEE